MIKRKKLIGIQRLGHSTLKWNIPTVSSWSTQEYINEKDSIDILNLISKISNTHLSLKAGLNILIDKHSNIPRPKLKEFINDNKLNKVTLASKANIIVVRRDTAEYIKSCGLSNIQMLSSSDRTALGIGSGDVGYHLDQKHEAGLDKPYFDLKSRCITEKCIKFRAINHKKLSEQIDFLFSLVNSKAILIFDDMLMSKMNTDGLDLDDDIYNTLEGMMLSKDKDTFNLGIEMLSNINLENNLFNIARLLNHTYTSTGNLSSLSQIKSKNFKALLDYVESNGIRWNQRWESFGMSMLKRFGNDIDKKNHIRQYIIRRVNDNFKSINGNDIEEIVNIVFEKD